MSISDMCMYALVVSSSLLLVYFAIFFAARLERVEKAWSRLRGRLPRNSRILLQTLPYYLAVTRSTCEVIKLVNGIINQGLSSDSYLESSHWTKYF